MKFNFLSKEKKCKKNSNKIDSKISAEKIYMFQWSTKCSSHWLNTDWPYIKRYMFCKINIIKTCNILRYHLIYLIMMKFASLADWIVKCGIKCVITVVSTVLHHSSISIQFFFLSILGISIKSIGMKEKKMNEITAPV